MHSNRLARKVACARLGRGQSHSSVARAVYTRELHWTLLYCPLTFTSRLFSHSVDRVCTQSSEAPGARLGSLVWAARTSSLPPLPPECPSQCSGGEADDLNPARCVSCSTGSGPRGDVDPSTQARALWVNCSALSELWCVSVCERACVCRLLLKGRAACLAPMLDCLQRLPCN